jgi:hypothetical protein
MRVALHYRAGSRGELAAGPRLFVHSGFLAVLFLILLLIVVLFLPRSAW